MEHRQNDNFNKNDELKYDKSKWKPFVESILIQENYEADSHTDCSVYNQEN